MVALGRAAAAQRTVTESQRVPGTLQHTAGMRTHLLVSSLLLPLLFWCAWHYYRDRHRPEPLGVLLGMLAGGVMAAFAGRLAYAALGAIGLRFDAVELALHDRMGLLLYATLVIGPVEELVKFLPFILVVPRLAAHDEERDGVIYASFIGIGFALVENFHYLPYLGPGEAMARGLASPIVHVLFASIWGYYVGRALVLQRPVWPAALASLTASALLHGLYDFVALQSARGLLPAGALLILLLWTWRLLLFRQLDGRRGPAGTP